MKSDNRLAQHLPLWLLNWLEDRPVFKDIRCNDARHAALVQGLWINQFYAKLFDLKYSETSYGFVVSEKKSVEEALAGGSLLEQVDIQELRPLLREAYEQIASLTISQGLKKLGTLKLTPSKELREAVDDAYLGLLFGYKPCCVKYYILSTTLQRQKAHIYENNDYLYGTDGEIGHLLCEKCCEEAISRADKNKY